jgi:hypothetical protein
MPAREILVPHDDGRWYRATLLGQHRDALTGTGGAVCSISAAQGRGPTRGRLQSCGQAAARLGRPAAHWPRSAGPDSRGAAGHPSGAEGHGVGHRDPGR